METVVGYISLLLSAKNQLEKRLCLPKEKSVSSNSNNLENKNKIVLDSEFGQYECSVDQGNSNDRTLIDQSLHF